MSGLFKRWQQRREEVAEHERVEELLDQQQAAADAAAQAVEEQEPAPEDLPDPETIEQGGSFAGFLKEGVDPLKRQQALKALWSQPQYNVTDGLSEYSLDYAAQPVLDKEVAAELAENVFRHAKEAVEKLEQLAEADEAKAQLAAEEQLALTETGEPDANASAQPSPELETPALKTELESTPSTESTPNTRNLS